MSKRFIGTLLGFFIVVGGVFFWTLYRGIQLPAAPTPGPSVAPTPVAPPPPSVTLTLEESKGGNTLLLQWSYLPNGTASLEIFRSTKGKDNWTLWKTITLTADQLANGSLGIDVGSSTFSNYSFYVEAVGNGDSTSTTTSTLWTSSSTDPVITTSTSNSPPPPPPPPNNPPSEPGNATTTPTSTPPVNNPPSSTNPGGNTPPPTPSGTPYYSPQIQITGYGQAETGNFWVQHVDQKIQIGWQNLPSITDDIVIVRSSDQGGPWSTVLTQQNQGVDGAYSIQVVDDTLDQPYYYELNAEAGGTIIATYGPVYLAPIGE
jgi:hypothetical protein